MLSTIGIIIDFVIIATLVIAGIIGFKRGFLKSFISLFSWVVCLIISILVARFVANWINGIYNFSGLIGGKISEGLSGVNEFFNRTVSSFGTKDALIAAIPSDINGMLIMLVKAVFNGVSDEAIVALEAAGCSHARQYYTDWVTDYETEYNAMMKRVAEWYSKQDFYNKEVGKPRTRR